jgi:DNA-binding MarR family transcriptional regulator
MAERRPLTVGKSELITAGSDREFRVFLHAFMVFARRLEGVRGHLAQAIGVSATQYEILSHLREHTAAGGLTVNEAAERLHCTGAFVTTESGKLVRMGLVTRNRDASDARRVRLTLSSLCERRFREIASLHRQLNDTLFASVTARQFQMLRELFPKLVDDGDRAIALAEFQMKSGVGQEFVVRS